MSRSACVLAAVGLILVTAGPAFAQGSKGRGPKAKPTAHAAGRAVFRETDQRAVRDYFRANRIVPADLPPGIAKNVTRGKPLPPGIAKRVAPAGLIAIAPPLERGYVYALVGPMIVALDPNGLVVDILVDVF